MKVAGSSIAAYYYAGNAALKIDQQGTERTDEAARQLRKRYSPQAPAEQVLEGELLNKRRQQAHANAKQAEEHSASAQQESQQHASASFIPRNNPVHSNPAVQAYEDTSQLDGLANSRLLHQIDIYV